MPIPGPAGTFAAVTIDFGGTTARRAGPDDAEELVRLRIVMLAAMDGAPVEPGAWSERAIESLRRRLTGPDAAIAAFVVDRPGGAGLAACATGVVEERLGSPGNPGGLFGYVFNVATDPDCRRRGYSRACLTALLGWFGEQGVPRVTLRASSDGLPLYERLGFTLHAGPVMDLAVPAAAEQGRGV
ncbi:GNAT family N-acetyltransferase [Dactylosporangium darangshiense]|uniref:GNAT family N-acetyltransferase n=1 Tax=Dactylosporangium darangshiense TaxID=579108 RepID=A0ABP8DJA4_9ACTN